MLTLAFVIDKGGMIDLGRRDTGPACAGARHRADDRSQRWRGIMTPDRVKAIEVSVAGVTPKTSWIFVEIETASGLRGVGEASLIGREDEVLAAARKLAPLIMALREASPDCLPKDYPLPAMPEAAAFSAIDQALWDVTAQR